MGLKETIATSLACVGLLAIPGTITHTIKHHIDWTFAVPLCIGVIPGAQIGARFAIKAADRSLRRIIGIVLGSIAVDLRRGRDRRARPVSSPSAHAARANTASSMSGVSLPVNVFCWLGW